MTTTAIVQERTILDLNPILHYVEDILKPYIANSPFNKYYGKDLLYCKGYRFPITSRSEYFNEKDISDKPFYGIVSALLLEKLALLQIQDENPNRAALFRNELLNKPSSIYGIGYDVDPIDIYHEMFPNISVEDYGKIENLIQPAIDKILAATKNDLDAIYSIDISAKLIVVKKHEHILAYRYKETLDFKWVLDAEESECKEVHNDYNNR